MSVRHIRIVSIERGKIVENDYLSNFHDEWPDYQRKGLAGDYRCVLVDRTKAISELDSYNVQSSLLIESFTLCLNSGR